jgi:hypothetical protein
MIGCLSFSGNGKDLDTGKHIILDIQNKKNY